MAGEGGSASSELLLTRRETLHMLREIRMFLTEDRWTANALARDGGGFAAHPLDEAAVRWCLVGACGKIAWAGAPDRRESRYSNLMSAFVYVMDGGDHLNDLPRQNDLRGYDWSMEVLDKAIAALSARTA